MADTGDDIFNNLPRRRKRAVEDDDARSFFRERRGVYVPEGPLPPRPHQSGKGGPSINQGAGPPPVTSVWSAADAAANAMTLSNGGLTVNYPGSANWASIRNTTSKTSGKLYVEFVLGTTTSGAILYGLASSGFDVTQELGATNYSIGFFPTIPTTSVSTGFTSNYSPNEFTPASGDVIALAIDFTAGSIWYAQNNVWANSSNPATGSLPAASFVLAIVGALFAGLSFHLSTSGTWTLQATAASQTYAPPAGFTPWG